MPDEGSDLQEVREVAAAFFAAWNARDVARIAPLLSGDAEFVNSLGLWWRGADEVVRGLSAMNAIGPAMTADAVSARLVARDAAICSVALTAGAQRGIATFFMVRRGERWSIAGAQTTPLNEEAIARVRRTS